MQTILALAAMLHLVSAVSAATDPLDRLEPGPSTPFLIVGKGVINDGTHPVHPGSFRPIAASIRIAIDPNAGVASIEIETGEGDDRDTDR